MIWIKCRFIHYLVAKLALKFGESRTTGNIVVEVTAYHGVVSEWRNGFIKVGNGVEDNRVSTVVIAKSFRRKKVYKAFKYVATWVAVGDMRDVFRRVCSLKK